MNITDLFKGNRLKHQIVLIIFVTFEQMKLKC